MLYFPFKVGGYHPSPHIKPRTLCMLGNVPTALQTTPAHTSVFPKGFQGCCLGGPTMAFRGAAWVAPWWLLELSE